MAGEVLLTVSFNPSWMRGLGMLLTDAVCFIGSLRLVQRPRSWVSSLLHHESTLRVVPSRLIFTRSCWISFWTLASRVVRSTQALGLVWRAGPVDGFLSGFSVFAVISGLWAISPSWGTVGLSRWSSELTVVVVATK